MNILLLAHKVPHPLLDGYNLHNANYCRQLAEEHRIHLVTLGEGELPEEMARAFASIHRVPVRPPPRAGRLQRLVNAVSVDHVFDFDPAVWAAIHAVLDAEPIDVVWAGGTKMLPYSRRLTHLPVLADVADEEVREALVELRRARGLHAIALRLRNAVNAWRFQRAYLAHADVCTVVSETDRDALRRNCPGLDVRLLPNGVDVDHYRPVLEQSDRPTLVFEGTMHFPPNVEGIVRFCGETLPLVKERVPDVQLVVVGRDPDPRVQALAGPDVHVTGLVDDVRTWVGPAHVFVCPLYRGAGIKNKILQAWSMQKPVVATPASCGGLIVEQGDNLIVVDDAQRFADAVVQLLGDPHRRTAMGAAGRRTVLEHYTWERRAGQLAELMALACRRKSGDRDDAPTPPSVVPRPEPGASPQRV